MGGRNKKTGMPGEAAVRRALAAAQLLCDGKCVPLTRDRLAAQLGVTGAQLEKWAGAASPAAAALRQALQECQAQVLEYCLRTDVRHEQLGMLYLRSGGYGDDKKAEAVEFTGEDRL
ncbi:MAG: hypothetical protein IKI50_05255 [Clostridia bacterium]|nr:hypothetical protein [Clostridia bacterium]